MSEEQYGIEEVQDFLKFGFAFAEGMTKALEDGKWNWLSDSLLMIPALAKAPAAFDDLELLKNQLLDISKTEKEELVSWAMEEFDIAEDEVEEKIEDSLELVFHILTYVNKYK